MTYNVYFNLNEWLIKACIGIYVCVLIMWNYWIWWDMNWWLCREFQGGNIFYTRFLGYALNYEYKNGNYPNTLLIIQIHIEKNVLGSENSMRSLTNNSLEFSW